MAASAAKRPRPALEAGASADAAWFQANVMRRDDAVAWWRLPHFPKLAAGAWVRVVGKPSGYELMRVQKVLVAHKPYALPVPGGEPVPCTALLMVRSFLKGELKPRTLAQLSNSPPTREEAEALLSALAREGAAAEVRMGPLAEAAASRRAMAERIASGRPAMAAGKPWGTSREHVAMVLLRSWAADEAAAPAAAPPSGGAADPAAGPGAATGEQGSGRSPDDTATSGVTEVASGADTSAFYRVCLSEATGGGAAPPPGEEASWPFGMGPSRLPEKWRGVHSFLLQHRAAEGSPGKLYPAMATAAPIDGAEPEATAARAVRQFLGGEARGDELAAGVTAEAIAAAVVEHRELVGRLGTPAFEARQAVPVRQASPDALVAIASAGAVADVKRPVAPFGRAFGGATHFFVVDIDALVRSGAVAEGWGRRPFGGIAALDRMRSAVSALPRSAVSHPFPPRSILAADEEEAAAVTAAVPAAVAVISRRQARGLNPGDWPSLLQAGSGPPSPSAHANAAGSDPARGPGGGADAPDSEAEHDGRPVFAADSRPADAASYRGVPFLPILGHALAAWRGSATTVVLPRSGSTVRLFHGTAPSLALAVLAGGFKRPACRFNPPCKRAAQVAAEAGAAGKALAVPRGCECQMMGFGVYLARRAKAFSYAARRAEPLPSGAAGGGNVGAVIECEVDLGCTHHAIAETCACGCGRVFSDHHGIWYSRRGCDSVFLDDGSMPATATAEWAVADPARVRPVSVVLFRTDA
ncbi:hypothetical protein FNF29_06698 [Cafeteria roenbergensis]|uniref:Plus3 domain-containing protein n=1 Tax=Cafeteria roenbergensis TaxID=33653 RepID=A0A5A8C9G2_CAFRO|nr:hypothetical protein FNF29_06698 [Cafeteria roenbergensis]|eukprot:KAA0148481.1 hypothetical protein FNF29_06698 [Cafeteria roenbergensis]